MKKKILFYTETFCARSETFIYRVANALRENYEVIILTHLRENEELFPWNDENIFEFRNRNLNRFEKIISYLSNRARYNLKTSEKLSGKPLIDFIQREGIDYLFANFGTCGIRLIPVAGICKIPLFVMFWGCDLTNWLGFSNYKHNLQQLLNKGDFFFAPSQYMIDKLHNLDCRREKAHLVYNPAPSNKNRNSKKTYNDNSPNILHVGRLVEKKGITYTIRAFASVQAQHPKARLTIVGEGPERSKAEAVVNQLGLQNHVYFTGALPYNEVEQEFEKADIFVLHSLTASNGDQEGLPTVLCEAMSYKLPVVSTLHSGIPEIVIHGQTGYLVEERDVEKMSYYLDLLLSDQDKMAAFGNAGFQRVNEVFSKEAISQEFFRLMEAVANSR